MFYETHVSTVFEGNTTKLRIIISRDPNNSLDDDKNIYLKFANCICDAISENQIPIIRNIEKTGMTFTFEIGDVAKVIMCLNNLGLSSKIKIPDNFRTNIFQLAKKIEEVQENEPKLNISKQAMAQANAQQLPFFGQKSTPSNIEDDTEFKKLVDESQIDQGLPNENPEKTIISTHYSGLKR